MDLTRPTWARAETKTLALAAALQGSADPSAALPLIMGEWLTPAGNLLARPGTGANVEVTVPLFPYINQQGDVGVQSLLKGSVIVGPYEAWTLLWDEATNPPVAYGDNLSIAVMGGASVWNGYAVMRISAAAGFDVGFAIGIIPTATGTGVANRLYFRSNY